jgi:hypothetical protein
MTKRVLTFVALALSLLVPVAGDAQPRVTLYELSERVTFSRRSLDGDSVVMYRNAISPLFGTADLGTPLCPSALLIAVPRLSKCTVTGYGTSDVSTVTGTGWAWGMFDVLINAPGNSKVHVPNLPVITGTFDGQVDLSRAVLASVPLGSIAGTFTITQMADASGTLMPVPTVALPFTGTFRIPVGIDSLGSQTSDDDEDEAFYLADDLTTLIRVRDRERSVGFPPVRLEVRFGP